jgi:uncharacterized protein YndB with AHSA1/START domain
VEVERWIRARPETVFSYFSDPERFRSWLGQDASIHPHPGGDLRVPHGRTAGGVARGQILEMVAPSRVVFTWEGAFLEENQRELLDERMTVEISMESRGRGTLLRLRQTGLAIRRS